MVNLVFFGSSPFSTIVLEKLTDHVSAVVTTPDKPAGRHLKLTPNPVKLLAQKHNLPVVENLHDSSFIIHDSTGLVAAYGKIIPQSILDKFNGQIYNIHPSLLPKYRGPSPLQQQILDGITETGVTIIKLDEKMDHGPIVAVANDIIFPGDTTHSLGERLFAKGADLFLSLVLSTSHLALKEQDDTLATYTQKLTRQSGFVPWDQFNPSSLNRQFRAFHPWPGVWTLNPQGVRLKLVSLHPPLVLLANRSTPEPATAYLKY